MVRLRIGHIAYVVLYRDISPGDGQMTICPPLYGYIVKFRTSVAGYTNHDKTDIGPRAGIADIRDLRSPFRGSLPLSVQTNVVSNPSVQPLQFLGVNLLVQIDRCFLRHPVLHGLIGGSFGFVCGDCFVVEHI